MTLRSIAPGTPRAVGVMIGAALFVAACGSDSASPASPVTTVPAAVATTAVPLTTTAPAAATTAAPAGSTPAASPTGEPYGTYRRVEFATGTDNATVSDAVAAGTVNGYLYAASAGQSMYVNVSSSERYAAVAQIYGPDGVLLAEPAPQDPNVAPFFTTTGGTFNIDLVLPADGDYLIVVSADPGLVADLEVEITGSGAPTCASYVDNDTVPFELCDRGDAVLDIQQALADAGFAVDVDGFFGAGTDAAVRQYQAANGLGVDGIVGPATYTALIPA